MQIKNTEKVERKVSRDGVDIPVMPGASIELPLTKDEAKAFEGLGFEVTGEPAAKKAVAKAGN